MDINTKTVEFFWNAAKSLPKNSIYSHILKCHYLSKCKKFAEKNDVGIYGKLFGDTPMCKHCCTLWTDSKYRFRISPSKILKKRLQKILEKKASSPEKLTCYEKKLLNGYEKRRTNKMELVCSVCHRKSLVVMKKPHRPSKQNPIDGPFVEKKKKKQKKKTKDPFAGLKHSAVIAAGKITSKQKLKDIGKNVWILAKPSIKSTVLLSNPEPSHFESLSQGLKRKSTLQKILGSSQSSLQGNTSKLQNFLASLNDKIT